MISRSHYLRLLTFLLLVLSGAKLSAQDGFLLTGEVVDSENGDPVSFAQAALFEHGATDGAPIAFENTDIEGKFSLRAPKGEYDFKIFFLGYEDKVISNIKLQKDKNLGSIDLTLDGERLEEVVIEGRRAMMKTTVEGITINPDENMSNLGGTLLDILRNTPSVRVSDDGSISLRGSSGTNVLINGRNSSLTENLERIPASAIDQVKIINNPNARYDAEAEAGVVDIILKSGENLGTNVSVDALYGTRDRMNFGGRINHRTVKYNVYGGYNYRDWKNVRVRRVDREIFGDNELLNQETKVSSRRADHTFNFGADYYFGNNILC
jgi:hypothetical protein